MLRVDIGFDVRDYVMGPATFLASARTKASLRHIWSLFNPNFGLGGYMAGDSTGL